MLSFFILLLALTGHTLADDFFVNGEWKEITNNVNFPIEHNFLERNLQFRVNRTLLRPNWKHIVQGKDHETTYANEVRALSMTFTNVVMMLNAKWKLFNDPNAEDVDFFRCIKKNYISDPVCGGQDVQIWTWNFIKGERLNLYCYDQLEFFVEVDPANRVCAMFLNQDLGDVNVRYMAQGHWRSTGKDEVVPAPETPAPPKPEVKPKTPAPPKPQTEPQLPTIKTSPQTEPQTKPLIYPEGLTTEPPSDDPVTKITPRKTCDCWTAECGWCSDGKCRVSHDLTDTSSKGISVTSPIKWVNLNTVFFFDGNGDMIGSFRFNRKGIFLTGCVKCRTPRPLPLGDLGVFEWSVAFEGSELVLYISGEEHWRQELVGECAERYSDIQEFAFGDIGCDGVWYEVEGQMESGSHFTDNDTCGSECAE